MKDVDRLQLEKQIAVTSLVNIHVFITSFPPMQGECNQFLNKNSPDLSLGLGSLVTMKQQSSSFIKAMNLLLAHHSY